MSSKSQYGAHDVSSNKRSTRYVVEHIMPKEHKIIDESKDRDWWRTTPRLLFEALNDSAGVHHRIPR